MVVKGEELHVVKVEKTFNGVKTRRPGVKLSLSVPLAASCIVQAGDFATLSLLILHRTTSHVSCLPSLAMR